MIDSDRLLEACDIITITIHVTSEALINFFQILIGSHSLCSWYRSYHDSSCLCSYQKLQLAIYSWQLWEKNDVLSIIDLSRLSYVLVVDS